MKHYILLLIFVAIMIIAAWETIRPTNTNTNNSNGNLNCVSEPRDIAYNEQCCTNLKTIWGFEKPDGSCECSGKDGENCFGANTCAPCGNNKCEVKYREDKCSCPEDCK